MKIGFCVPMSNDWIKAIDNLKIASNIEVVRGIDACLADFSNISVLVAGNIDNSYYQKADKLKAIFIPFVGANHLPANELIKRNIDVFNCHGNAESVAEKALSMALAGFGRLIEYHNDLYNETWHGFWVGRGKDDFWHSIFRKRCAILGTGAIGEKLAQLLKAFDCSVTGFRRSNKKNKPKHFDNVTSDLYEAITNKDIVFVALPLTDATQGLIGEAELKAMQGAFLVNVGRGAVINEEALYHALKNGILRGAGIDVWYNYPQNGNTIGAPSKYPIHKLNNVILSPHVAGSTWEAAELNITQTIENLELWLKTNKAMHKVNLIELY